MDATRIDRITLQLGGTTETEARRLGILIAQRLADADLASAGATHVSRIQVTAASEGDIDLDDLSQRIVAEILARLARGT